MYRKIKSKKEDKDEEGEERDGFTTVVRRERRWKGEWRKERVGLVTKCRYRHIDYYFEGRK